MNTRQISALPALLATLPLLAADFDIRDEAEFRKLVPAQAKVEKLAGDMTFTEGPVWVARGGYLVFSDIPANKLMQWSPARGLSVYRDPSQNANGNTTDRQGRLVSCEHTGRRVVLEEAGGTLRTLADKFEGRRLNSPNDVAVTADGAVWFTDPDYGLKNKPGTQEKEGKEQPGNFVYRVAPGGGRLTAVVKDCDKPNGLAFSPDEKRLYVADSGAPKHIRVFDVRPDGSLTGGAPFCKIDKGAPDGIRVDAGGRVWSSAGDGVQIFAPDGKLIGKILVPEAPANLAFGGASGKTLFITARKSLYAIEVSVTGAGTAPARP
jgi:gluconolactonase